MISRLSSAIGPLGTGHGVWTPARLPLTARVVGGQSFKDTALTTPATADSDAILGMKDVTGNGWKLTTTLGNAFAYDATEGAAVAEPISAGQPIFTVASVPFNPQNGAIYFILELATSSYRQAQSIGGITHGQSRFFIGNDGGFSLWTCSDTSDGLPSAGIGKFIAQDTNGSFHSGTEPLPTSRAILIYNGSASKGTLYVNGHSDDIAASVSTSVVMKWVLGYMGGAFSGASAWNVMATLLEWGLTSATLTAGQIASLLAYGKSKGCPDDTLTRLIVGGDSISADINAALDKGYQKLTGFNTKYTSYNVSQGGISIQTMAGDVSATIVPLIKSGRTNQGLLWAGTNDITLNGRTAAQVYADSKTWGNAYKAATGAANLAHIGVLPRSGNETVRQALRTLYLADFTVATANPLIWAKSGGGVTWGDYYVDVAADTTMGLSGQNAPPYYNADDVHPSNTGHQYIATNWILPVYSLMGVT